MPTDASFRFSTYLTLALTCVALGYAEFDLLPEVAGFALLAVVALGVMYFLESRVEFLSIPSANRLGVVVFVFYLMWAAYRVKREVDTGEMINLGWHTLVVAMCGPLVMLVIVAKMARREKHAGDYWLLHGVALAGVGLTAAYGSTLAGFVLVSLYLVVGVWSFTLLYLGLASGAVPPVPGGRQPATKTIPVSADPTGHRLDLGLAVSWALLAMAVAVPVYLLTPRSEAEAALDGKFKVEIGYAAGQMVNLNSVGKLEANDEVAFTFTAANAADSPKADVNPEQRFRGSTRKRYVNGQWERTPPNEDLFPGISAADVPWRRGQPERLALRHGPWFAPTLGHGQFTFRFQVPSSPNQRGWGRFMADPVLWVPDQPPPLATLIDGAPHAWVVNDDGSFYYRWYDEQPRRYVQVYRYGDDPDAGTPFRFTGEVANDMLDFARDNPVSRVKDYADSLLADMVKAGKLPADYRIELNDLPRPEFHEAIALAFTAHLATTPALSYTTNLRRENMDVDPVEEFLYVTKVGHCERFASALALMLRSQGIPAVLVLGFKGCEQTGPGEYVVKQANAHAWVEALVPKAGEPFVEGEPLSRVYHWRSLDPTPGGEASDFDNRPWWEQANGWVESRFETYVTNYTAEERRKALAAAASTLTSRRTLIPAGVVIALLLAGRFAYSLSKRRGPAANTIPEAPRWFGELIAALAAHGIAPDRGATPREFAEAAADSLRRRGCGGVAGVPPEWADAYYLDRFGGVPPSDARMAELDAGLDALRRALEQRRSG